MAVSHRHPTITGLGGVRMGLDVVSIILVSGGEWGKRPANK